tara:strand:- start:91 stop:672 length:582 start_codon:yes stop_codon:yes gene_type:complete
MTILSECFTKTLWHNAFTIPDIPEGKRWYLDVLGCKLACDFSICPEHKVHIPGFIFSFAGHHISVIQGETSVPQETRVPRHSGPIFLDEKEYFEVVDHCVNHPEINVISAKWNNKPPFFDDIAPGHEWKFGQNAQCHHIRIKDPWSNWIEMKYYKNLEQILGQNISKHGNVTRGGFKELYGKTYDDIEHTKIK